MNRDELLAMVALGEDSRRQFKADVTNADSLAADLVAFSNSSGGVMLIGVADDGNVQGLIGGDVRRINQLITNAATQSPTQSSDPVHRLVMALGAGALSAHELRTVLGIRHRHTFRQNHLRPALRHGLIELTIPDKPNSRLQRYRLTEVGRGLLAGPAGGESE
jgi:hypothetical protein